MKVFHLELPPVCNQSCVFCVISAQKSETPNSLDVDFFVRKTESETEIGDTVFIWGGEPTAWSNIEDLFLKIVSLWRSAYLITNGSNPGMIDALRIVWMKKVVVSFFSSNPKIHRMITGKDHFDLLCQTLAISKVSKGLDLHVNYVICRFNEKTMRSDVKFLIDNFEVKSLTFQPIIPYWRANLPNNPFLPSLNAVSEPLNDSIEACLEKGIQELKVGFFPHCLLNRPELAEKHAESKDAVRKALSSSVLDHVWPCKGCSRFGICAGIPKHYPQTRVVPFD